MENPDTPAKNPNDEAREQDQQILSSKKNKKAYTESFCGECGWAGDLHDDADTCPNCGVNVYLRAIGEGLNTVEGTTGLRE